MPSQGAQHPRPTPGRRRVIDRQTDPTLDGCQYAMAADRGHARMDPRPGDRMIARAVPAA